MHEHREAVGLLPGAKIMFLCDSFHVGPALNFLLCENNFLSSGLAERFVPSEK